MNTSPISSARPILNAREQAAAGASLKAASTPVSPAPAQPDVAVEALSPAQTAPVDTDRVALIRKAIADGSYPIVPAKIADAIIAAGILLRTPK